MWRNWSFRVILCDLEEKRKKKKKKMTKSLVVVKEKSLTFSTFFCLSLLEQMQLLVTK